MEKENKIAELNDLLGQTFVEYNNEYAHVFKLSCDMIFNIESVYRIKTPNEIVFVEKDNHDSLLAKKIISMLKHKPIIDIKFDECTQDLRIKLSDNIVVDIFSVYYDYENWNIDFGKSIIVLGKHNRLFVM